MPAPLPIPITTAFIVYLWSTCACVFQSQVVSTDARADRAERQHDSAAESVIVRGRRADALGGARAEDAPAPPVLASGERLAVCEDPPGAAFDVIQPS